MLHLYLTIYELVMSISKLKHLQLSRYLIASNHLTMQHQVTSQCTDTQQWSANETETEKQALMYYVQL